MKTRIPVLRRAHAGALFRLELLESRILLHGGHHHDDDAPAPEDDIHAENPELDPAIVALVQQRILAGEDVAEFLGTPYDPHVIGVQTNDGILNDPIALTGGGPGLVLPDMIPWTGPSGSNYYKNISFDTFTFPGRKLMRFSTAIANAGDGPVELRAGAANPDGTQQVHQRLYNFDPVTRAFTVSHDRLAGNFIYHSAHNHLHFEGYAEYRLLMSVDGQPGGPAFRSDGTEVLGEKVGFCLINVTTYNSNHPGYNTSPGGYGCGNLQGISVGRADVYSSGLDAQWIDVTGVPAGQYFLEVTLDVGNAVQESNDDNNVIRVPVTISSGGTSGGGVQPDRFDNIAPNNSFDTATDLGELGDRTEATLTLHATYDEDFYSFVATSTAPVSIQLPHSSGNPDLYLYNDSRNEIARSTRSSGTESLSANLFIGQTYYIRVSLFQSTSTLVGDYALLIDGPLPTITAEAAADAVAEIKSTTFDIIRNGPTLQPLIVGLEFSGTATYGVDYTVSATSASFGAEASRVTITLKASKDAVQEGPESVFIGIASGSNYVIGSAPLTIMITERIRAGGGGGGGGNGGSLMADGGGRGSRLISDGGSSDRVTPGLFPPSPSEQLFGVEPVLDDSDALLETLLA